MWTRLLPFALAGFSLLCGIYLTSRAGDARHLAAAERAGLEARYFTAIHDARRVEHRPSRGRAFAVEGYAYAAVGRYPKAAAALRRAVADSPSDWRLRRDWATSLLLIGRRTSAQRQMGRALALNPRMVLPPGFRR